MTHRWLTDHWFTSLVVHGSEFSPPKGPQDRRTVSSIEERQFEDRFVPQRQPPAPLPLTTSPPRRHGRGARVAPRRGRSLSQSSGKGCECRLLIDKTYNGDINSLHVVCYWSGVGCYWSPVQQFGRQFSSSALLIDVRMKSFFTTPNNHGFTQGFRPQNQAKPFWHGPSEFLEGSGPARGSSIRTPWFQPLALVWARPGEPGRWRIPPFSTSPGGKQLRERNGGVNGLGSHTRSMGSQLSKMTSDGHVIRWYQWVCRVQRHLFFRRSAEGRRSQDP